MSTKELQNTVRQAWKKRVAENSNITKEDVLRLCIVKAVRAKSNQKDEVLQGLLLKSFTPITNKNKLENGCNAWDAIADAYRIVNHQDAALYPWRKALLDQGKMTQEEFNYLTTHFITDCLDVHEKEIYFDLLKTLGGMIKTLEDKTYVYIFVRQDISPEQQLVQAAHVTSVLGQAVPKYQNMKEQHFVVFGVINEHALIGKIQFLGSKNVNLVWFHEPDNSMGISAIACLPMRKSVAVRKQLFDENTLLTF